MKKLVLSSVLLAFSLSATAEVFKCTFTEPFITSTYSTTQSKLTYTDYSGELVQTLQNVSLQAKAPEILELRSSGGKVLQTLRLTHQGSDGMSDNIYPYEVTDHNLEMTTNGMVGGCSSDTLPVKVVN